MVYGRRQLFTTTRAQKKDSLVDTRSKGTANERHQLCTFLDHEFKWLEFVETRDNPWRQQEPGQVCLLG